MFPVSLVFKSVLLVARRRAGAAAVLLAVLTPGVARSQIAANVGVSFALASAVGGEEIGMATRRIATARHEFAGRDEHGVPHYARRFFSAEERRVLREQFGIEEPQRLYLSDTMPTATVIYDTGWDRGEKHMVGSHRVGARSVRRRGETWEQLEARLARTSPLDFPVSTHEADTSLASLDPVVRPLMESMLAAARQMGFKVKVTEARRTAERQAYLMTLGNLTHTATSRHAEGYAVDVTVDDGDIRHATTREHWVAFRRWVERTQPGVFRIIGTPGQSWDWPHIEYVGRLPGFGSLEELIDAARWCDANGMADCTAASREGEE